MIFGEGKAKDFYRRAMWGPGMSALSKLPATWEHNAFRLMGRAAAHLARRKRAEVEQNLLRAFGSGVVPDGRSVSSIVDDVFATHFANQYVGPSFSLCTAESWPRYLAWKGLAHIHAAERDGVGVVLAHPHMGPAQLPLHVLGLLGKEVIQVGGGRVTRVSLSDTGEWARQRRESYESKMPVGLHDGRAYLRPLVRALQSGVIVLSAADGTGGGDELGRRLNRKVLGHDMPIPLGPTWLALRGEARLHTLHCHRNPTGRSLYTAEIGPEIHLNRDRPLESVLEEGANHLARWLEMVLREHPGDWLFWDGFAPGALLP